MEKHSASILKRCRDSTHKGQTNRPSNGDSSGMEMEVEKPRVQLHQPPAHSGGDMEV